MLVVEAVVLVEGRVKVVTLLLVEVLVVLVEVVMVVLIMLLHI